MKKLILSIITTAIISMNVFADSNEDLFNACKKGDIEGVKSAIANGANVNATDNDGNLPISHSFFWPEIVNFLIDKGADVSNSVALLNSGTFYCEETFKLLLSKGVEINKPVILKSTVDMAAAYKKALDAENAKGKDANKALIKAYEKLMKDAGPPKQVSSTAYPFFTALGSGNKAILDEMVRVNTDFKALTEDGQSAMGKFVLSVRSPEVLVSASRESVKTLEGRGYKIPDWFINMDISKFYTPAEVLGILTSKGCDVNAKIKTGFGEKSPLMTAMGYQGVSASDPNAIIALIKAGANVSDMDDKWGTIINLGVRKGNLAIVKAIVEAGADINVETKEYDEKAMQYVKGFTPLTLAAMINKLEIVDFLLRSGSKPSEGVFGFSFNLRTQCATTVKNKTAIYFAIENANMDMIKVLVEHSTFNWADKKFTTNQLQQSSTNTGTYVITTTTTCFNDGSYIPSKYAKEGGLKEIQEYLKSNGL